MLRDRSHYSLATQTSQPAFNGRLHDRNSVLAATPAPRDDQYFSADGRLTFTKPRFGPGLCISRSRERRAQVERACSTKTHFIERPHE
jgi:hypothetical protein